MQFFEKDVETLRGAYQQLSTQITRSDFIRLVVLFIMIASFARAFEQINTAETDEKQKTIKKLETQMTALQNIINSAQTSEEKMAALQNINPAQTSEEKMAALQNINPAQTSEEKMAAQDKLQTIEFELKRAQEALETIYRQAFRAKIPFVGGDPTIDLRSWIYWLPFLFILSEVYLFILRKQLKLLSLITTYYIQQRRPEEVSTLDRLLFAHQPGKELPYPQHPSQLLKVGYICTLLALALYLVVSGYPFWKGWGKGNFSITALLLLTVIPYAIAYAVYVARQLERQVQAATGLQMTPGRLVKKVSALTSRLKPEIPLSTGAILIGTTLFLATSVNSCSNPHRGYDLVRGWAYETYNNSSNDEWLEDADQLKQPGLKKRKVYWPTIGFIPSPVERTFYITGIALAGFTFLLLFISRWYSRLLQKSRCYLYCLHLTILLGLFSLIPIEFLLILALSLSTDGLIKSAVIILLLCYGLIPCGIWLGFVFARQKMARVRWLAVRSFLIYGYLPVINFTGIFMIGEGLYGVPVYIIGIYLLALGYLLLVKRDNSQSLDGEQKHELIPTRPQ